MEGILILIALYLLLVPLILIGVAVNQHKRIKRLQARVDDLAHFGEGARVAKPVVEETRPIVPIIPPVVVEPEPVARTPEHPMPPVPAAAEDAAAAASSPAVGQRLVRARGAVTPPAIGDAAMRESSVRGSSGRRPSMIVSSRLPKRSL